MKFTLTTPSFLSGFCHGLAAPVLFASRVGQKDSTFLTPEERDLLAMRSDWELVGESLKDAIQEYDHSVSIQNLQGLEATIQNLEATIQNLKVALQEQNHSHDKKEESDNAPTSETATCVSSR